MNVYQIYSADVWLNSKSKEDIGIASSIEKARGFVKSALSESNADVKIVIETCKVDEYSGYAQFEVYDFECGLEYKNNDSDAEYGFLKMVSLKSDYYDGTYSLERILVDIIINTYMEYMEKKT